MAEETKRPVKLVTMAEATLNTGQALHAVNDFFIGQRSHVSARYRISVGGQEERQSSSGIIVSTGLGSTGWLRSVGDATTTDTRVSPRISHRAPKLGGTPLARRTQPGSSMIG